MIKGEGISNEEALAVEKLLLGFVKSLARECGAIHETSDRDSEEESPSTEDKTGSQT